MGKFEELGKLLDTLCDDARKMPRSKKRAAEVHKRAAETLEIYFLWMTGWVPNPDAPRTLVENWWVGARKKLDQLVETAWTDQSRRALVMEAGLARERFVKFPSENQFSSYLNSVIGALLGFCTMWPELVPPGKLIPPLVVPQAPSTNAGYSPSMAWADQVNQNEFNRLNAFMATQAAQVAAADAERNRLTTEYINRQWNQR